jgi:hypothetical protein
MTPPEAMTAEERRARLRAKLERLAPGTLAFMDMTREKFPNAKVKALEIIHPDGRKEQIVAPKAKPTETTR